MRAEMNHTARAAPGAGRLTGLLGGGYAAFQQKLAAMAAAHQGAAEPERFGDQAYRVARQGSGEPFRQTPSEEGYAVVPLADRMQHGTAQGGRGQPEGGAGGVPSPTPGPLRRNGEPAGDGRRGKVVRGSPDGPTVVYSDTQAPMPPAQAKYYQDGLRDGRIIYAPTEADRERESEHFRRHVDADVQRFGQDVARVDGQGVERNGVPEDMARSFFQAGLPQGVTGLLGAPRDLLGRGGLLEQGVTWGYGKLGLELSPEEMELARRSRFNPLDLWPASKDIDGAVQDTFGQYYEPQTTWGEATRTVGHFVPGAAVPGGWATRGAAVLGPALGSEAAGQLTEGTAWEPWARFGGAALGGAGVAAARAPLRSLDDARPPMIFPAAAPELPSFDPRVAARALPEATEDVLADLGRRGFPVTQVAVGPSGPVLHGLEGKWLEAVEALTRMQTGEALRVLHHPGVGHIDVLWKGGERGLQHIVREHEEVLPDLPERLSRMVVEGRQGNLVVLATPDGKERALIASTSPKGTPPGQKTWLLTAYERK
jgi:hypothetical protein